MVFVLQCSTLCDHCSLFLDKNSNAHDALDAKCSIKLSLSDMVLVLHCSTIYDHCSLVFVFFISWICIALHSCISF